MTQIEQVVREVSNLRDFFRKMEPLRRQIQLQEARRAAARWPVSPKKSRRKKHPAPAARAKRERA